MQKSDYSPSLIEFVTVAAKPFTAPFSLTLSEDAYALR